MSPVPSLSSDALPLSRDRVYRNYWIARSLSLFGDRITDLALPWFLLQVTATPLAAAAVLAIGQLPQWLLYLPAGALADRVDRRRLMVLGDLLRGAALLLLAAAAVTGRLSLYLLAAALVAAGSGAVLFSAASGSLLPLLVGRRRLAAAEAGIEAADAAATISGPPIGGLLLQAGGAAVALTLDAVSFLVSALLLRKIPPTTVPHAHRQARGSFAAALRTVRRSRGLRWSIGLSVVMNAFSAGYVLMLVALMQQLALGAAATGLVLAAAGVGGLAASLLLPKLARIGWGRLLGSALALSGLAGGTLAAADGFAAAFSANLLLDAGMAAAFIVAGTVRGALTDDALLGRVTATAQLLHAAARTAGTALTGLMLTAGGPPVALTLWAATLLLFGLVVLFSRSLQTPLQQCAPDNDADPA